MCVGVVPIGLSIYPSVCAFVSLLSTLLLARVHPVRPPFANMDRKLDKKMRELYPSAYKAGSVSPAPDGIDSTACGGRAGRRALRHEAAADVKEAEANETRRTAELIRRFNSVAEARLEQLGSMSSVDVGGGVGLRWLRGVQEGLAGQGDDSLFLRPVYSLEGMHLTSGYLPLVEEALASTC